MGINGSATTHQALALVARGAAAKPQARAQSRVLAGAPTMRARGNEQCFCPIAMAAPKMPQPRSSTPRPPSTAPRPVPKTASFTSSASVVAIRPRPPAFPSGLARPVVIEEDVVEYLAKASLEQRWRILSRVALATRDEVPASDSRLQPPSTTPLPPSTRTDSVASAAVPSSMPPSASAAPPPPSSVTLRAAEAAASGPPTLVVPTQPAPSQRPAMRAEPATNHLAEQLFQAMQALRELAGAPAGARLCLETALCAVPSLAALVHVRDAATHDLVVVHTHGPRADTLLGLRTPQADALVARALRAGKPSQVLYGSEPGAEGATSPRHAIFDPWSVVLVPVVLSGQMLALLEMIDPTSGRGLGGGLPLDEFSQGSLAYIAECLGRFLAGQAV